MNHIMTIFFIVFSSFVIIWNIRSVAKEQKEREDAFKKWMFESLYSIDKKVLLPEEHAKPLLKKKATIYEPEKNPMKEFVKWI